MPRTKVIKTTEANSTIEPITESFADKRDVEKLETKILDVDYSLSNRVKLAEDQLSQVWSYCRWLQDRVTDLEDGHKELDEKLNKFKMTLAVTIGSVSAVVILLCIGVLL